MPKQILKIDQFHGGLNTYADPRDIADNELSALQNASVSSVGRIVAAGSKSTIASSGFPLAGNNQPKGYGLFAFSADYNKDGTPDNDETSYLVLWDDSDANLYWIIDAAGETWAEIGDISSKWNTARKPCFYFVDGALRMSDGHETSTEESVWWGYIKNALFGTAGGYSYVADWFAYDQELKAPTAGTLLDADDDEVSLQAHVADNTLSIHIRHNKALMGKIVDDDGAGGEIINTDYVLVERDNIDYFVESSPVVVDSGTFRGDRFFTVKVQDQLLLYNGTIGWEVLPDTDTHLSSTTAAPTFGAGQSVYGIYQLENENVQTMWEGGTVGSLHYDISEESTFHLYSEQHDTLTSANYMSWPLADPIGEGWTVGDYKIVEYPYENAAVINGAGGGTTIAPPSTFTVDRFGLYFKLYISGGWVDGHIAESPIRWGPYFIADSGQYFTDSMSYGPRSWGYSFIYRGGQESTIHKYTGQVILQLNYFPVIMTAYHMGNVGAGGAADHRIIGANIYVYDNEDIPFKVADCDFTDGLKSVTSSDFTNGSWDSLDTLIRKSNTLTLNTIPLSTSYESLHGYGLDEEGGSNFKASYGNVVVNNRRAIVAPVFNNRQNGFGEAWYRDTMIGTTPNEFDLFPNKSKNIEVSVEDGDKITALAAYADRILQFKENTMYLVNVTQTLEYLEDTFKGKGVSHPGAVCKTDFGIAWANKNGCFFYDSQKVDNLSDMKISDSDWSGHMDSNSLVGYHPNSRKIIVTGGGTNNINAYVFDLVTKSWAYMSGVFDNNPMTNFVNNSDGDLVWAVDSDGLRKWTETSAATSSFSVLTKDFDFGQPGQRKKIYKVYVTYTGGTSGPQPEITKVVCLADSSNSLDQKSFYLTGATGKTLVWIDTNGSGSAPIPFTDATCDTSDTVGSGDTFNSNPRIIQMNSTSLVEVGMFVSGTGITGSAEVTAVDSSTLFRIDEDAASDQTDTTLTFGYTEAAPPLVAKTIKVVSTTDATAERVAIDVANAIGDDAEFLTEVQGDIVTITDAANATRSNAADGNTGFAITTIQEGTGSTVAQNIDVTYATNGGTSFSQFDGNLDNSTGNQVEAELKPSSAINNIKSLQLKFDGTAVSTFEINDISIVYRIKSIK